MAEKEELASNKNEEYKKWLNKMSSVEYSTGIELVLNELKSKNIY